MAKSARLGARRALTAGGVAAAVGAAAIAASLGFTGSASARDTATYSIWFKGLRCIREAKNSIGSDSDETFLMVAVRDGSGLHKPMTLPKRNPPYFKDVDAGEIRAAEVRLWSGPAQDVIIYAHLYEYDGHDKNAVRLLAQGTLLVGSALAGAGSVGTVTAAQLMVKTAGGAAISRTVDNLIDKNMKAGGHDPMGSYEVTFELAKAGRLADAPQKWIAPRRGGRKLTYDLSTRHTGSGAIYELYWEVRRTGAVAKAPQSGGVATAPSNTTVQLCNRSGTQKIFTALAYWEPGGRRQEGWTSRGWWGVARNQCTEIPVANSSYVYVYAEAGGQKWSGRDATFCVNDGKAFKLAKADERRCGRRPYKRVKMSKFKLRRGSNTWNFK